VKYFILKKNMNRKIDTHLMIISLAICLAGGACIKLDLKTEVKTERSDGAGTGSTGGGPTGPGDPGKPGIKVDPTDTMMADMEMPAPTIGQPSGNGDLLSFSAGNSNTSQTGCYPASGGWDRYYPLPKLMLGPNTASNSMTYPNMEGINSFSITTVGIGNPAGLETAIVAYPELAPWDRTCVNVPLTGETLVRVPTTAGVRYKVGIFYKNNTLPPGTSINVRWAYP
jgi:hypothetical protein